MWYRTVPFSEKISFFGKYINADYAVSVRAMRLASKHHLDSHQKL